MLIRILFMERIYINCRSMERGLFGPNSMETRAHAHTASTWTHIEMGSLARALVAVFRSLYVWCTITALSNIKNNGHNIKNEPATYSAHTHTLRHCRPQCRRHKTKRTEPRTQKLLIKKKVVRPVYDAQILRSRHRSAGGGGGTRRPFSGPTKNRKFNCAYLF